MPLIHNGIEYARVSDVIAPFANYQGISPRLLEYKGAKGTNVHESIYEYITEGIPWSLWDDCRGYFDSFLEWEKIVKPEYVEMEERYFNDEKRLTGKPDNIIKMKVDGELVLVDWKTSVQENKITWPMQAHLYHYLLKPFKKISSPFLFVKLNRYGHPPMVFSYNYDKNFEIKCLQAVDDYWKNKKLD